MRADEGDPHAALAARKDAALQRWPHKSGDAFESEMAAIARELDLHARALDRADADPLDRLRAWCAAGEAWLSLGQKFALQCAAESFRYAESAAARAEASAHELMRLKHQFGLALLRLAADTNAELAAEAATRLSTALSLARKHMPVGVVSIKLELFRAEHTVTKLRGARRAPARDARPREAEAA